MYCVYVWKWGGGGSSGDPRACIQKKGRRETRKNDEMICFAQENDKIRYVAQKHEMIIFVIQGNDKIIHVGQKNDTLTLVAQEIDKINTLHKRGGKNVAHESNKILHVID